MRSCLGISEAFFFKIRFTFLRLYVKIVKRKSAAKGRYILSDKLRDENVDYLFKAILKLNTVDECYDFFEDLCTVTEIKALSQRIAVAKMLRQKMVYSDIVAATGASTATISRVNRSLQYGCNGYDEIFKRMEE